MIDKRIVGLMLGAVASVSVHAGDWRVSLSGVYSQSDSSFDASIPGISDALLEIDFEKDLSLSEEKLLPEVSIGYRFDSQHRLSFSYLQLHREGTNESITKPFDVDWIDGQTYQVQAGARIKTTFNYDIYRLTYGYDFFAAPKYDLGITLGLHVIPAEFRLEGEIAACAGGTAPANCASTTAQVVEESITAPLPNAGFFGRWNFYGNWSGRINAQYFDVSFDNFGGSLIEGNLLLSYTLKEAWDFSMGYSHYRVQAKSEGAIADFSVDVVYQGPRAQIAYTF